jgi:adenine-specific DNA-methyltransferase
VRARYLQPMNGARVDAIRERIARLALEPELEAIALVAMEARARVDSDGLGVQDAPIDSRRWAARAYNQPLRLARDARFSAIRGRGRATHVSRRSMPRGG